MSLRLFVRRLLGRCVLASAGALALSISSSASAQVVYEPVQYQYQSGGQSYYYGGSDPRMHWAANAESGLSSWGRSNGYAFHSARLDTHREVSAEPVRVFADQMPTQNARFFGYSVDDARNQAYANSYTYFRKADLLKTAQRQADGTWSVPAQPPAPGTIEIRPYKPAAAIRPLMDEKKAAEPKPILIIPKRLLDKPLWGGGSPTADAGAPSERVKA